MSAVSDNRQWAELADDGTRAAVAQLVERVLGKDEVTGPSPVSSFRSSMLNAAACVGLPTRFDCFSSTARRVLGGALLIGDFI